MAYSVRGSAVLDQNPYDVGREIETAGVIYHEKHTSYAERGEVYVRDPANLHCWVQAYLFFRKYYSASKFDEVCELQIFHEAHLPEIEVCLMGINGGREALAVEIMTATFFVQNLDYDDLPEPLTQLDPMEYVAVNWDVRHITDPDVARSHWLDYGRKNLKLPNGDLLVHICQSALDYGIHPLNTVVRIDASITVPVV
jgi:hypothetical protein